MKSLMLLLLVSVSISFGGSYRQHVAWTEYNSTDTSAITFKERVHKSIRANGSRILSGKITRDSLFNNNQFTDAQMTEFARRAAEGLLTNLLIEFYLDEPQLDNYGLTVTDARLNIVFKNCSWAVIKMIFSQSL